MLVRLTPPGWYLSFYSIPIVRPPDPVWDRYDALLPGSLLIVLWTKGKASEAVWEPHRCSRRGGFARLRMPPVVPGWRSSARPLLIPERRAVSKVSTAIGRMAEEIGLSRTGTVARSAIAHFPKDLPRLVLSMSIMEA